MLKTAMRPLLAAVTIATLLCTSAGFSQELEPLYPILRNSKWGLIDGSGTIILPPKFDQIARRGDWVPSNWVFGDVGSNVEAHMSLTNGWPVTDSVIPVRLNGQFGFAKRDGDVMALGRYEEIGANFSDGLIDVVQGGLHGFANASGDLVVTARYDYTRSFRDGFAFVNVDDLWGIIDVSGSYVITPQWDFISPLSKSLWEVRSGDQWGVIDPSGAVIFPIQYDKIGGGQADSLISVRKDNRVFYLHPNCKGTVAFELTCPKKRFGRSKPYGISFFTKLALVRCQDLYGLVDDRGNFVLEPKWDDIKHFKDGRAIVRKGKQYGLINESGDFVLELTPDYRSLYRAGDSGWFIFQRSGGVSTGFMDRDGNIVFETSHLELKIFREGLVIARDKSTNKDGYIDLSGNWVIEPRFHRGYPFRGPLAVVEQPVGSTTTEIGYVNKSGEVVFKTQLTGFVWPDHLINPDGIGN